MNKENAKKVLEEIVKQHEAFINNYGGIWRQIPKEEYLEVLTYALTLFDEVDRLKQEVAQLEADLMSFNPDEYKRADKLQAENDRLKAEVKVLQDDEKDCEDCSELDRVGQEIDRLKGRVGELENNKPQGESYPIDWTHCIIHLNKEKGIMHSDGDHSVRGWIEEKIQELQAKLKESEGQNSDLWGRFDSMQDKLRAVREIDVEEWSEFVADLVGKGKGVFGQLYDKDDERIAKAIKSKIDETTGEV